ncbi:heme biosynthesis protein HemY [Shewanella mangrovi]|uniref:Heme biosynthesis protein HemY n=1 Tax=Shewanella mangrovi TaxID=1515746 RepID=A0A094JCS8_9GAMM|nr:heme biosynthesis HemY N-terminal domain-containing protein [Shewanella mangrovi]KFZ37730.1 heme biosynthesis protein HemY [Shewanella mangrovi]
MIRVLFYLLVILAGALLSPLLVGNKGYVYISFLGWQLETSVIFAIVAMVVFYGVLQLLEWLIVATLNLVLSSRYLPQRWRRKAARKHTLVGALAIAEENWSAAERAMRKGAEQGEIPVLNYLAAARAAQHQLKTEERDEYLDKAAEVPLAFEAVTAARTRYLLRSGDLELARTELDKLKPTSKSKAPLLKLAKDVYLAQQDWMALRSLLPALLKRQLIDEHQQQQLTIKICTKQLQAATTVEELNTCWGWLTRHEKSIADVIASYALALNTLSRHDDAVKLLSKQLKQDTSDAIYHAIATIITPDDEQLLKLLQAQEVKCANRIAYQHCVAEAYEQKRELSAQLSALQKLTELDPTHKHFLALAQLHEQLANHTAAADAYRAAANAIDI